MAPNTCRGGFIICHFVHNYTHNSKTEGRIRTFYLSNDSSTIGDISSLELQVRYNIYISLYGTQLRRITKVTYLMTVYYTPKDSFTANDAAFHKNKVG